MSNTTNMNQATKVITGEVRFSYLHVFEKSSINGSDEKYSVSLLIPKSDKKTIVHHIYPAAEYPEYAYCDWNLISVSMATHNKLENRSTGTLTEMGLALQRRTIPGVDWRK